MIIDLSYFNQVQDWHKVKDNVDGVILRLGYTGYSSGKTVYDKRYHDYLAACMQLNIPVGVYFFPQSIKAGEAEAEADFIKYSLPDKCPLGVWLDSEIADVKTKAGRADKLSRAQRTELLLIIINSLKAAGINTGVYASTSWLNNQLDMSKLNVPVWVAQYNSKCTYTGLYCLWQYTSKGSIPGIKGNVDLNKVITTIPAADPVNDYALREAIDIFADRVIQGKFGQGHDDRMRNIYSLIRSRVNDILK